MELLLKNLNWNLKTKHWLLWSMRFSSYHICIDILVAYVCASLSAAWCMMAELSRVGSFWGDYMLVKSWIDIGRPGWLYVLLFLQSLQLFAAYLLNVVVSGQFWHKGPVLRPRCIGPRRAWTQIPFILRPILNSK